MTEAVIVALITGAITLAGNIIALLTSARKTENNLNTQMAVMETKLNVLTDEVRVHNDFGRRIPVIEEQIKVANHRIDDLEKRAG